MRYEHEGGIFVYDKLHHIDISILIDISPKQGV